MKDTFDKVVMDENRKSEMRSILMKKKPAKATWLGPVIGVAAAIAVIMIVPFTRGIVVNAAGNLISYITSNHNERTYEVIETAETDENGEIVTREVHLSVTYTDMGEAFDQDKDGKLYFVLDGEWTEITDKCSETEYYRYEEKTADGSRIVICVGGTPDNHGNCQMFFDPDGECIGVMSEVEGNPEWCKKALADEGVEDSCRVAISSSPFDIIIPGTETEGAVISNEG